MRKKSVLFICLIISMCMISGCASNDENKLGSGKSTPTIITVWTYYNGTAKEAFDGIVEEFNNTIGQENNIIIDAYSQGDVNELADAVFAATKGDIGSEPMPHIFSSYQDNAFRIDNLGKVANVEDYFTEEELLEYRQDFLSDGIFGEGMSLKIIPFAKSSENIFINSTDFNKFAGETGVKLIDLETWEGMAKTAEKYYEWTDSKTEALNDGKAFFGIDAVANFMLISVKQLGADFYEIDGDNISINFSPEVAKKIWDNFYVPYVKGHYANVGRFRSDDAKVGDILAYSGSTAGASYFPKQVETGKDSAYPIECIALQYPHYKDGNLVAVQQGAGMVIAKSDKEHEKASALFLKWLTDTEQNIEFATLTGYLPVKEEALSFELFKSKLNEVSPDMIDSSTMISAETTYKMMEDYSLYSYKPFEKSQEARTVLEKSMMDWIKKDLEEINKNMDMGRSKEESVDLLNTDKNFQDWYNKFVKDITYAIEQ